MATFINQTKNTASFTGQSKNSSEFSTEEAFLLKEDTYFLLLETGYKIDISYGTNKATTIFTNQSKN